MCELWIIWLELELKQKLSSFVIDDFKKRGGRADDRYNKKVEQGSREREKKGPDSIIEKNKIFLQKQPICEKFSTLSINILERLVEMKETLLPLYE